MTLDRTRAQLAELPELTALIAELLITGPKPANAGRATPGPKPPCDLDAIALLDERQRGNWLDGMQWIDPEGSGILPYLYGWARDLEAEMLDTSPQLPDELPDQPTVSALCSWLGCYLDFAATLPQWQEFADGIAHMHARARHAAAKLDPPKVPIRCRCGEQLRRHDATRPLWECHAGHTVSTQPVTIRDAAKLTGEPERTIRRWAQTGKLAVVADGPRQRLVDLIQVRGLAAARRLRESAG